MKAIVCLAFLCLSVFSFNERANTELHNTDNDAYLSELNAVTTADLPCTQTLATGPCGASTSCNVDGVKWTQVFCCCGTSGEYAPNYQTLAAKAQFLRIYRGNDNKYVESTDDGFPLQQLRLGKTIAFPVSGYATEVLINSTWTGDADLKGRLWNSCGSGSTFDPLVYWACNNQHGLHLNKNGVCEWDWSNRGNVAKNRHSVWIGTPECLGGSGPCGSSWQCIAGISVPLSLTPTGDVQCMSTNNKDCLWDGACESKLNSQSLKPLVCGAMHQEKWGSTGYDTPGHWCATGRKALGDGKTCTIGSVKWQRIYDCCGKVEANSAPDYQKIAQAAQFVRIYRGDDNKYVESGENAYPLARLRAGYSLAFPASGYATTANIAAAWTGDADLIKRMWNSCGTTNTFDKQVYWACNNQEGMHLFPYTYCEWNWGNRNQAKKARHSVWVGTDTSRQNPCSIQSGPWAAGRWQCIAGISVPLSLSPAGDVQCMSRNSKDCLWDGDCSAKVKFTDLQPLVCGGMHKEKWGSTGYDTPGHWCATGRKVLGSPSDGTIDGVKWRQIYSCCGNQTDWSTDWKSLVNTATAVRIYRGSDNTYVQSKPSGYAVTALKAGSLNTLC